MLKQLMLSQKNALNIQKYVTIAEIIDNITETFLKVKTFLTDQKLFLSYNKYNSTVLLLIYVFVGKVMRQQAFGIPK